MPNLKLLFVHVPKTGGSSIAAALHARFGERFYRDHDSPGNPVSPMNIDPDGFLERNYRGSYDFLDQIEAVAGHLWIRKYDPVLADIRAVILRHPVERTISHYFFWRSPVALPAHPLRDYLIAEKLDISGFARLPIMRWFYSRHIFRDTDMGIFDYVGEHSDLQTDWAGVMRRLGLDSPQLRINETRAHSTDYPIRYQEIMEDPKVMSALRDILADDIEFYERALAGH